jgi:hypothetical protein
LGCKKTAFQNEKCIVKNEILAFSNQCLVTALSNIVRASSTFHFAQRALLYSILTIFFQKDQFLLIFFTVFFASD